MTSAAPEFRSRPAWPLVLPLFFLLGFGCQFGPLTIALGGLWLPAAAWLGWRYGERGVTVIAVAGLPLLVGIGANGVFTANWVGLYIAAIVVCRLVALDAYRDACIAADLVTRRMLAFLFLALACDAYFHFGGGAPSLNLSTSFATYLWLLLLVLGLSAAPLRAVLACLVLAACAGFLVRLLGAGMPSVAGFGVAYRIAGPQDIAAGAAALLVGRLLRQAIMGAPCLPARLSAKGMLLALLVLSLALSMVELRIPALSGPGSTFPLRFSTGSATALLLFACGLAGGGRMAVAASVVWLGSFLVPPLLAGMRPTGIHIVPPSVFVGLTFALTPSLSIALLDPIFALLGWRIGRQLALRASPPAAALASGTIPPPLRFRFIDKVGSVLGGAFLAGSLAAGLVWLTQ